MGRIVQLQNKKTGENEYPRTYTKAIIDDQATPLDTLMQNQNDKIAELGSEIENNAFAIADQRRTSNINGMYRYSYETEFVETKLITITLTEPATINTQVALTPQENSSSSKQIGVILKGESSFTCKVENEAGYAFVGCFFGTTQTGDVTFDVRGISSVVLSKSIEEVNKNIENIEFRLRTQPKYNVIDGSINYNTGAYDSYLGPNRWGCVRDWEVASGDVIEVKLKFPTDVSLLCTYCVKDEDYNVIEGKYLFPAYTSDSTEESLTIPKGGRYVSFSFFRYEYDDVFTLENKTIKESNVALVKVEELEKVVSNIETNLSEQGEKVSYLEESIQGKKDEEFIVKNGYTDLDGSYSSVVGDNNNGTTSDIKCSPKDKLEVTLTLAENNDLMTWVTCKDKEGNAIKDLGKYLHTTYKGTSDTTIYEVPDNVYSVVFSFWRFDKGYTFSVANKSLPKGLIEKVAELDNEIETIKGGGGSINIKSDTSTALALGSRLVKSEIPSYWFDEVNSDNYEKVGTYLDEKIASVPQGKHFIWITDCHYQGDITNADNRKHSAAIVDYVRRKLNIKTILHGGDVMQERNTALAAAKDWIAFNDDFVGRLGSDFKQVCGDHDHNAKSGANPEDAVFTFAFAQKMLTAYNTDNLVFDHIHDEQVKSLGWSDELMSEYYSYNKMHYYYDDASIGTRFIVLFTGWAKTTFDFMAQTIGNLFEDEEGGCLFPQMDFLYQALMTLPDGYNVVVCGHNVLKATPHVDETAYGGNLLEVTKPLFVGFWHIVANMLRAFMNKTTTSNPIPCVDWSRTDGTYPSKTYDYTKAPNAGIVFSLGGDQHADMMCKSNAITNYFYDEPLNLPSGGTYKVGTQMLHIVSISDGTDRGGYLSYPDRLPLAPLAESGTINEQAFDIFTLAEDGIYITRIGAGNDRVVYFE